MAYSLYLDSVLVPVTPAKIKLKVKNQNKTLDMINDGEVNFLKSAGLSEIQFDLMIPQTQYPFAVYTDGFKDASYFLNHIEKLKTGKKGFQFIVSRVDPKGKLLFDTNMKVSLEEYQITEDAEDGFDITVTVKLKQYRNYGTKMVVIKPNKPTLPATADIIPGRHPDNAPSAKTYTVVKGDCLWNIAKKCLGNGARYKEIYNLNKDKINNPRLIFPGQVLTLP